MMTNLRRVRKHSRVEITIHSPGFGFECLFGVVFFMQTKGLIGRLLLNLCKNVRGILFHVHSLLARGVMNIMLNLIREATMIFPWTFP